LRLDFLKSDGLAKITKETQAQVNIWLQKASKAIPSNTTDLHSKIHPTNLIL